MAVGKTKYDLGAGYKLRRGLFGIFHIGYVQDGRCKYKKYYFAFPSCAMTMVWKDI